MKTIVCPALFFVLLCCVVSVAAQRPIVPVPQQDTVPPTTLPDTIKTGTFFTRSDIGADSVAITVRYSRDSLDAKVDYKSRDSMIFDVTARRVYLYGEAQVNYTTIELKADFIVLDWGSSIVTASGLPDSTGKMQGLPIFKDRDQVFNADSMRYNFQTRKALVYRVVTQQNDVIVIGARSKFTMGVQNIGYNSGAIFTTCTHPEPHFGVYSNKQKVITDKLVVVGPSNLRIMDVPTPLWLPFGFFPLSKGRRTGLLFPRDYEYSPQWGFGLRDIGWYFPLGDHFNLSVTSNLYLKGRWGVTAASQYRKRYKYNGDLRLGFEQLYNEDNEGNITRPQSILFSWSHRQDRSAHPSITIGGSINIQSNNYRQRVFNDAQNVLNNQLNSNFAFNKVWQDKPINFSASFNHSQNTLNNQVNISFPNLQFQTQTLYPLRRKERAGQEKWYETITLRYTSEARNTFRTTDTTLFSRQTLEDAQYGIKQTATSGTSFKLFKYFNLNPNINYDEVWYFQSLLREFDPTPTIRFDTLSNADGTEFSIISDTTRFGQIKDIQRAGFQSFRTYSISLSLNTQLFGTMQFRKGWLRGLRHVAKINTSLSFSPDYLNPNLNYFRFVQADSRFPDELQRYSIFENGIYGGPPPSGPQMAINYGINNIFEAKIRKDTADRKIKLFDNLIVNGFYNMVADSLKWSPLSMSGTTRFFKGVTTFSALVRFDPYALADNGRGTLVKVDRLYWRETGKVLRFSDANLRFNTSLTIGKIREIFQGKEPEVIEDLRAQPQQRRSVAEEDFLSLFENFSVNHNFVLGWNTNARSGEPEFDLSLNSINVQGNIQLSKNWRIGIGNFGYDFVRKDFTYPSVSFSRDLHCWDMGVSAQPTRGTYNFFIQVKPGSMEFLRLPYERNNADAIRAFR